MSDTTDGTVTAAFPVITDETFPEGVRCLDCDQPLRHGAPYSERLEGVTDGAVLLEVVCVYCAMEETA